MIEYLFIIDFLESVIYEGPAFKKPQLKSQMKQAKEKCLTNCIEPNFRYRASVGTDKTAYDVLARTNEDNIIIGVLVSKGWNKEAKVWNLIDMVFGLLIGVDVEANGLNKIRNEIEEVYNKANDADTSEKINSKLSQSINKVELVIEREKDKISDLAELDTNVEFLGEEAREMNEESVVLKRYAFWESKKLTVLVWVLCIGVIIGVLTFFSFWFKLFV